MTAPLETVRMRPPAGLRVKHAALAADGCLRVASAAVPAWERLGWKRAEAAPA